MTMTQDSLIYDLAYRPPLDWSALLGYLNGRSILGVEMIEGDRYGRTVDLEDCQGWITVEPVVDQALLRVRLSSSLGPVRSQVLSRLKSLFDLDAEPGVIAAHLGTLALEHPGLRVPGAFDGFEIAVRTILGQQVSVKAAKTVMGRFVQRFSGVIVTPFPALTHLSPRVEVVAPLEAGAIATLGIIGSRANSILALARAIVGGSIVLGPGMPVGEMIAKLQELPGIGPWTASYIAMRVLEEPDIFLASDLGIRKAMGETNVARMVAIAEVWRPWRSYATLHLWKTLERPPTPNSGGFELG
jgi:AraC family transcriptional regulator, regulatory protein of adaptative response / DNA-3-methyladenine glycosylase II